MTNFYYTRWWAPVTRTLAVLGIAGFAALVQLCAVALQDSIAESLERYAASMVIVQAALLLLLVLGLVVVKTLRLRVETRRERRRREFEALIVAHAAGDETTDCAAHVRTFHDDAVHVIGHALQLINGAGRERLEDLLHASGSMPRILRDALHSDPNRAIKSVMLLGHLRGPDARATVEAALQHSATAVRVAACRAILACGSDEAQGRVWSELPNLPAWQRIVLFHVMPVSSPTLLELVQRGLESDADLPRLLSLEFVLSHQRALLLLCPEQLAYAASAEVRIKFFRALPFLQLPGDATNSLSAGLADSDWRVRAMAAQACGHFRVVDLAPKLLAMCAAGQNPVEAGHAARALTRLGGHAWERLQPLMMSGTEMVRRVAAEAVEKRMLTASVAGRI